MYLLFYVDALSVVVVWLHYFDLCFLLFVDCFVCSLVTCIVVIGVGLGLRLNGCVLI